MSATLKIRGGCDIDSRGNKAGKGPLVQWEKSGTLGVSQDQTLFVWEEPTAYRGGRTSMRSQGLGVNKDVSFTVNAVDVHAVCYGIDHAITIADGNCTAGGACIYREKCPTLKAYGTHAVFMEEKENV